MNFDDFENWIGIADKSCELFRCLHNVIDKMLSFTPQKNGDSKTTKNGDEENKRCKAILKKHNLPKSVGIMCKSEGVCFAPNKAIMDTTLNNLNLKSGDGRSILAIGGGAFALNIKIIESGFAHQRAMYGAVIRHKGEIYLLRHPLGGYPNYLARLDLFINGMIVEFDDGSKMGFYY